MYLVIIAVFGAPESFSWLAVYSHIKSILFAYETTEIKSGLSRFLLSRIIALFRASKVRRKYKLIKSPIVFIQEFYDNLCRYFADSNPNVLCEIFSLHAGYPIDTLVKNVLDKIELNKVKIDKVIVIPTFPQFAYSTSGAVINTFLKGILPILSLNSQINARRLSVVCNYYSLDEYIASIADSILSKMRTISNLKNYYVIFSFHSLPVKAKLANSYVEKCEYTCSLVAAKLGLESEAEYSITYHSKFGYGNWLEPSIEFFFKNAQACALLDDKKGLVVVCPGFAFDCLETLWDVNIKYKNDFENNFYGKEWIYVDALNNSLAQANVFCSIFNQLTKQ